MNLPASAGLLPAANAAGAAQRLVRHNVFLQHWIACSRTSERRLLPPRQTRHFHKSTHGRFVEPQIPSSASEPPLPPPSSSDGGIRDRLRFWKYDQDMKKQDMVNKHSNVEDDDGSSAEAQTMEPDLEDTDFDTVQSYMSELDRLANVPDDLPSDSISYQPGDLVELPGSGDISSRLAVYVRNVGSMLQYYTVEGKVNLINFQSALFVAPGYINPSELEPILQYLPSTRNIEISNAIQFYKDRVPRSEGAHLVKRLVDFHAAFEEAYRLNAAVFNDAHARVAHPTDTRAMSLEEIASEITGTPIPDLTSPMLLALSDSLLRNTLGFRIQNRSYGLTRKLEVESIAGVASAHRVAAWARAYQERSALGAGLDDDVVPAEVLNRAAVIDKFIEKVGPVINASRKLRNTTADGAVLTFKADQHLDAHRSSLSVEFSQDDLDIIRFLSFYVSTKSYTFHPTFRSMVTVILKASDLYNDRPLDAEAVYTMLVEIGVVQPFQDPRPWDRELVDQQRPVQDAMHALEAKIGKSDDALAVAGLHDSLHDLRVDFGDLPVFCIDAKAATEIDDGISVEQVQGRPGRWWIHAHISSVAAFIPPTHVLARRAETYFHSHYLPESKTPMLPPWVTTPLSLAPGRPCLTISVQTDDSGNTFETVIRPGFVRNVIKLTQDEVNAFFGHVEHDSLKVALSVGPDSAREGPFAEVEPPTLGEGPAQALRKLFDLTAKIHAKRVEAAPTGLAARSIKGGVTVRGAGDVPATMSVDKIPSKPTFATTDPSVLCMTNSGFEMELLGLQNTQRPSLLIVEEGMLLANRCAAQWAADRGIPIPYLHTRPLMGGLELEKSLLQQEISDMAKGKIPFRRDTVMWFRSLLGGSRLSSEPREHRPLGFPAYTRCTSPLRRFEDMVVHWNVGAAIREEQRRGTRLTPAEDKPFLPVPLADMKAYIHRAFWRKLEVNRFNKTHRKHWTVYALARAFYLKEFPLPEKLTAVMMGWNGQFRQLRIEQFDIVGELVEPYGEDGRPVYLGARWEVRIVKILPGVKRVLVQPVRLLAQGPRIMRQFAA